jgi:hypothetical protein
MPCPLFYSYKKMACTILTTGRAVACEKSVGGLVAAYFIDYGELGAITYDVTDTDVITAFAGTPTAYKYDLREQSSFEQSFVGSVENGTIYMEQTLNLTFTKLDKATNKELKLMAYGRPHIIVEDQNGNFFVMGLVNGAEVTAGTIVTGAAMGDLTGYTLTLSGKEKVPANFLESTLASAGVSASATQINP